MEPTAQTDRIVSNNKLNITIRNNKQETCMSIDAAIPADKMYSRGKLRRFKNMSILK